ncbi:MAG TPA: hypothetical protein VFT41_04470 [Gemmatimonadaceae bacterium]|nr:hypothetical protein [Gemmatimonadaceae bacterium]
MMRLTDNPVVALNYAVAVAMIDGPAAGLALLAPLDDDRRIAGHFRLDAVRGHLYARAGDRARAIAHLRAAADATTSLAERHHLITKIARLRNA